MNSAVNKPSGASWWRQAVVYQVYPRSFADASGDGMGDLAGVTSRVPYLAALGVDAVWLSPFYPSALADGGYDIDDYRNVDPRLGTLQDFGTLSTELHRHGIKLLVDIVPNHTSDRHLWFKEALASPSGTARDRYIFMDGTGSGGSEPPSDWTTLLGRPGGAGSKSAWTQLPDGAWYLHLFTPQQPDLNWNNKEVRDDFLETLAFWADRGVDGFRVDVATLLAKDMTLPLPSQLKSRDLPAGTHPYWDRDEVHDIYAEWRKLFNRYDPPLTAVAEAFTTTERRSRYASPQSLGQAFNFDLLLAPWDASAFRDVIARNLTEAARSGSSSTWVFSNHDFVRHASRYGLPAGIDLTAWKLTNGTAPELDLAKGLQRAKAATLLALALPGSTYLYQGEELGLPEVPDLPLDRLQDPVARSSGGLDKGRDGCRVPLPWTRSGSSFGFGDGGAHLPQPDWFADYAADVQAGDPDSTLTFYRSALRQRTRLQTEESLIWVDAAAETVHFARPNGWHSVTNFGPVAVPLPAGKVLLASGPLAGGALPTDTTAWVLAERESR